MNGNKLDYSNLSGVLERCKLSSTLAILSLILSAVLSLLIFLTGPVSQWAGFALYSLGGFPFVIATIFAITALIHSKLYEKMVAEEEEKELLQKRKENVNSILDISEDVRFTAKRALTNFEKYVPSAIAVFCFIIGVLTLLYFWDGSLLGFQSTEQLGAGIPKNPMSLMLLSVICAVFSFFTGVFVVGQSHVREFRYLRPVGSWLIAGAVVMFITAIAAILARFGKNGYDLIGERIVLAVDCILVVEFLICFVVEFYRPRTQRESRPVYESRFLSLFTEPGGVMRNIAESLDYQFGFKISKTGIYTFLQKSLIPALILWGFVFWLFTGIAEVSPGEVGIRERFGACVGAEKKEVLNPGVHLKLPWPFERIVRVPTEKVESVTIGSQLKGEEGEEEEVADIVLWTGQHYAHADVFLVANIAKDGNAADLNKSASSYQVSILEVSLPVFYRAKKDQAYAFAFNYENIADCLSAIGQAEATQYFASTDFMADISYGRNEVVASLKQRIQAACDKLDMGIEILNVAMHDAHPPVGAELPNGDPDPNTVDVASAFQDVVCAEEDARTMIARSDAYRSSVLQQAQSESEEINSAAEAYKNEKISIARAESDRYGKQLTAFRTMPKMFKLRTYLDFLETDCGHLRKYVTSGSMESIIYELNLEQKALSLMDSADLGDLGK